MGQRDPWTYALGEGEGGKGRETGLKTIAISEGRKNYATKYDIRKITQYNTV